MTVSYGELARLTESISGTLRAGGVRPGDRVGLYAPKSAATVAAILGILRAGAAYVPVDSTAPLARNVCIFRDCGVRAVLAGPGLASSMAEDEKGGFLADDSVAGLESTGVELVLLRGPTEEEPAAPVPEHLAYVLYTSGSTGQPKGVMHTHASALAFVDWCIDLFEPQPADRFSSHAPFHFDLSIQDLYVPLTTGATLVLIGEVQGKQPLTLAQIVATEKISVWYSTPSILRLMVEAGRMRPEDYPSLRVVLFAGEVFPVKHLQALKQIWRGPRFFNLYGPTETNVCNYYEIPQAVPEDRTEPYPIGFPSSGGACRVITDDGVETRPGEEGELTVSGPSVMAGYWNLPDRNRAAFMVDPDGTRWYRTGDMVRDLGEQCFDFLGRRDRMVKRRGYRVELGEIEAALYRHPDVSEVAVVAVPDEAAGIRINAFIDWGGAERPSLIRMKGFCADQLPLYMVPDGIFFAGALPKTSTDKIDYQSLINAP